MITHRLVAALLAMMLGAAMVSVLPGAPPASAAQGDAAPSDSTMTLSGKGEFANLQVTVGQTKNLINQVVPVTWQGGAPTQPVGGGFSTNYLQIMQCWGDDSTGPDRTQCQFGAAGGVVHRLVGGNFVGNRQVTYGALLVDPKETLKLPTGNAGANVPFWPVGRDKPNGAVGQAVNDFFDQHTTNEIPLARTSGEGTGGEFFEIQTIRQAAGLGCGNPVTTGGATTGRKCWLVVVPRGGTEVDGTPRRGDPADRLNSSPLSQSNWDNRIVFPLEFAPVGQACPLGVPERRVIGHELAVDAVSRWQTALCTGGGALYSYAQLSDDVARSLVLDGSSPGLALMTNPVPPDQAPPDRPLVYAPVGVSGLAIAFLIEHQTTGASPPADKLLSGLRFLSMKLTPRLVAKLLTQSYQRAVAGIVPGRGDELLPDYLKNNPLGLTQDPEFLELNPSYKGFSAQTQPPDALVQLAGSDLISLLWSWVKADPEASAFLTGTPDKHGMKVNPNNKDLTLPTSTFPRNDQSCIDTVGGKSCTLDVHPFFTDMHEAGLSVSRGDTGGRSPEAGNGTLVLKKDARQPPGERALLAVVDAVTADRYGLPTASLVNTAGKFVAPTTASLLAGAAAMKPSAVPGVLAADPGATDPAAYPLTALSYAVTSPSTLDAAAGKEYAAFVRYAAGPGQQPGVRPGQLPLGMAPLPDALRAQAIAAAATIEAQAGKTPPGAPAPQPTSAGVLPGDAPGGAAGSTGGPSVTAGPNATATNPGGGAGAPQGGGAGQTPGGAAQRPSGSAANTPSAAQQPVAGLRRTPSLPAPAVGGLLVAILICGALAATSSPVIHSPVLRRLGATVRRRLRRGVMPPEQ